MKRSWCAFGVSAALAVAALPGCTSQPLQASLLAQRAPAGQSLRIQMPGGGRRPAVRTVSLEDYVHATIISEFAPAEEDARIAARMLEVQAIIARTYAVASRGRHASQGFDLCSTTHCQLYEPQRLRTSRWASIAGEAVRETNGSVLWHAGGPAMALFHADCGGHTSTSVAAWGGTVRPYLVAFEDDGPAGGAHREWTFDISQRALREVLNADGRTSVGARLDTISVAARDRSGRAETVAIKGQRERLVRGEAFRAVVTRRLGPRTLKSTLFHVRRDGTSFVFTGRGFGHGVGLCQAGALARLRAGDSPETVLGRYYPGTTLARVR